MLSLYLALIDDPSDKELFEKIYTEYEKQMLYVANEVLNDEHLAEDACQIAFTRIATHIKKLRVLDENKTKCYLFISAKNAALDIVKKRQREKTVDIDAFYNLYDKKAHDEIEHISDESYIRYIDKEYLNYEGYKRTDDYIDVTEEELALSQFEDKNNLLKIEDNLDLILKQQEKNVIV